MLNQITAFVCSFILLLSCGEEQEIQPCADVTIDTALYNALVLENLNDSLGSLKRVTVYPVREFKVNPKEDDCYQFTFHVSYYHPNELDYLLVWDGITDNDTAHLYFYVVDQNFSDVKYNQRLGIIRRSFSFAKVRDKMVDKNLVVKIHYRENRGERYPGGYIIQM